MSDDIDTLNDLIEVTIDSADGYEQAAESAADTDLAQLFRRFGSERRSIVADLRAQVVRLGGEPEDDGSLLAGAHRVFLKLKTSVSNSRQSAIEEVERGEDHIKARYEDALEDDLTPESRTIIESAFASVKQGHDTMRAMKQAGAAATSA